MLFSKFSYQLKSCLVSIFNSSLENFRKYPFRILSPLTYYFINSLLSSVINFWASVFDDPRRKFPQLINNVPAGVSKIISYLFKKPPLCLFFFFFFIDIFGVTFFFVPVVLYFMFILSLDSTIKKTSSLSFLKTISSVNDLFKITIQILRVLFEICSISSVLNSEVKYPRKSFRKVTVTSVLHLLNCIGERVSFLGTMVQWFFHISTVYFKFYGWSRIF